MNQNHDVCSGSYSSRKASSGTASCTCTMLTLSALPHNIAQRCGQIDRLYPIAFWLRVFRACVFASSGGIISAALYAFQNPSQIFVPKGFDVVAGMIKSCSSEFSVIIQGDSGSAFDSARWSAFYLATIKIRVH